MGKISQEDHKSLVIWAAACAERVLPFFESQSEDSRPREAIDAALSWVRGEIKMIEARKFAFAAHAAAREAEGLEAKAAARAAGHAVATAHVPSHAKWAASYAVKAGNGTDSGGWQLPNLPEHLLSIVELPD